MQILTTMITMVMTVMTQEAAKMIELLLDHSADTTLLCNGHSPLSLAIVSGNDNVSYTLYTCIIYLYQSVKLSTQYIKLVNQSINI